MSAITLVNLVKFRTKLIIISSENAALLFYIYAPDCPDGFYFSINQFSRNFCLFSTFFYHAFCRRQIIAESTRCLNTMIRWFTRFFSRNVFLTKLSYMPGNVCFVFDRLPIHIRHVPSSPITYPFKCEPYFRMPNAPEYHRSLTK